MALDSPLFNKIMSNYAPDMSKSVIPKGGFRIPGTKDSSLADDPGDFIAKVNKQASEANSMDSSMALGTKDQVSEPNTSNDGSLESFTADYGNRKKTYSQKKREQPGCADCSTYTRDYYKSQGKDIGNWTGKQWDNSKSVDTPTKGDLIFWDTSKKKSGMNHVGIYDGKGNMSHFSTKGMKTVPVSSYSNSYKFLGYRRPK